MSTIWRDIALRGYGGGWRSGQGGVAAAMLRLVQSEEEEEEEEEEEDALKGAG